MEMVFAYIEPLFEESVPNQLSLHYSLCQHRNLSQLIDPKSCLYFLAKTKKEVEDTFFLVVPGCLVWFRFVSSTFYFGIGYFFLQVLMELSCFTNQI